MAGCLEGIRVLDLSRVLAGPVCTQILGDLGADIIKIERPGSGDDTRAWGPPFLKDAQGNDTGESAYYLSCNRNKRSVAVDISKPEGQDIIRRLISQSDVLIENFKVGGLDKYGLGYDQLKTDYPGLIYCAISGFGQNGPLAPEPGYDILAQALGGLMACTGPADGEPTKAGVALSDVMTGLYAAIGTLSALHHRKKTGQGQMVDVCLLDCTIAGMTNLAQYYLTSGQTAPRQGNAHASIVPYQAFASRDGHIVLAAGNDGQFHRLCALLEHPEWADDPRFATNSARVEHRETLISMMEEILSQKDSAHWVSSCEKIGVPAAPVQSMNAVFTTEQVKARAMQVPVTHPLSDVPVDLVGSPLKLSGTPVSYERAPPLLGQHTQEVLTNVLGMTETDLEALQAAKIIENRRKV